MNIRLRNTPTQILTLNNLVLLAFAKPNKIPFLDIQNLTLKEENSKAFIPGQRKIHPAIIKILK